MKMFRNTITPLCLFSLILLFTGCGGSREVNIQGIESLMSAGSRSGADSGEMNGTELKAAAMKTAVPDADYIIGPQDLLEIEVFQVDELKKRVRVSAQGVISLPLAGQIQAKGMTAAQLEREIALRLDRYLQEPVVSVYIAEYRGQKIGVIGAVKNPQVYSVTGQEYLLDMISLAGGIIGNGDICYVLRPVKEENGENRTETIVIDLKELTEKGNVALNIPVFGGDVINVPQGGVIFVDGAVNRPGALPMQGSGTTLAQTIAMAGGIKFEAISSDVKIFRQNEKGQRDLISVDYSGIKNGTAADIMMKDNDIVIVPQSGILTVLNGFLHIGGSFSFSGGAVNMSK